MKAKIKPLAIVCVCVCVCVCVYMCFYTYTRFVLRHTHSVHHILGVRARDIQKYKLMFQYLKAL